MTNRQSTFLREAAECDLAIQICFHQFLGATHLPWRQAAACDRRVFTQHDVFSLQFVLELVNLLERALQFLVGGLKFFRSLRNQPVELLGDALLFDQQSRFLHGDRRLVRRYTEEKPFRLRREVGAP